MGICQQRAVVNPATGKMETVDATPAVTSADVERTRRELRDMLTGNVPFHVDPHTPPAPPTTEDFEQFWTDEGPNA